MRRKNHFARPITPLLLSFLLTVFSGMAGAQSTDVYTVAKLSVDVRAKDAVSAKKQAIADAKIRALYTVMRRLAPFNSSQTLPVLKLKTVDDVLEGYTVRSERNSKTQYLATLDFAFNPEGVRRLLVEKNIPINDQQAEPVAVLPLYVNKGKIDHTGRDPWRTAWNSLDLTNAIVPVRLVRPSPAFTFDKLTELVGGNVEAYVALRDKYKSDKLVVAIAEQSADGKAFTTQLFGVDRVGSISLTRNDPIHKGGVKASASEAASIALGVIEGRWKFVLSPAVGEGGAATLNAFDVVVEFGGMREWRDIRGRLRKVPGVQALDVGSLSARTASVKFQFLGGPDRLSQALAPHGLALTGGEGSWVLRSN
ncbi:MAG: DUF2066 domain-containing protein [Hyphomicrobiaceae bacterium]|nr:DUF2066 domain-containing protein [Hyphomicrobiaceae bacterium]